MGRALYRAVLLLFAPIAMVACREPYPYLPYPEVDINFAYVVPAPCPLRVSGAELGFRRHNHIEDTINGLNLMVTPRGSGGSLAFSNSNEEMPGVDAALFATGPVVNAAVLPLPESGAILLLLRNNAWESHPSRFTPGKLSVRIIPEATKDGSFRLALLDRRTVVGELRIQMSKSQGQGLSTLQPRCTG